MAISYSHMYRPYYMVGGAPTAAVVSRALKCTHCKCMQMHCIACAIDLQKIFCTLADGMAEGQGNGAQTPGPGPDDVRVGT